MLEKKKVKKCVQRLKDFKGTIIVEGKNDKRALREVGVSANISTIKSSNLSISNYAFTLGQELQDKNDKVLILTDFDDEGSKLAKELKKKLDRWKLKIDHETRIKLKSCLRKDITGIESISKLDLDSLTIHQNLLRI